MENMKVEKIFSLNEYNLNKISSWLYDEWFKEDGLNIEEVKYFVINSLKSEKIPITYGLYLNNEIIGMYQFLYCDIELRPDIYPWLANVYISKEYRNKGYGKYMLNTVLENAKKINLDELYLYTLHTGLFEKIGFEFVEEFDTYRKNNRIQRLYKLKIK